MTRPSLSDRRTQRATDPTGLTRAAAWIARRALDAVLPPECVACGGPVGTQGQLCATCFGTMTFITEPCCRRCGVPFASAALAGADRVCAPCQARPPVFHQARAALLYDGGVRRLILPFKHADQTAMAQTLAPHMVRAGADLLARADVLVPVPLHRLRLFRRRYNQAAELAKVIGRLTGVPVALDALVRHRATPSLDHRGARERRALLDGAFAVRPSRSAVIEGRAVLLIDDVMTSGATADACSSALRESNARTTDVLVAARVPAADYRQPLGENSSLQPILTAR